MTDIKIPTRDQAAPFEFNSWPEFTRKGGMLLADPPTKKIGTPGCLVGLMSEHHLCVDCGYNTAPGFATRVESELAFMDGLDGIEQTIDSDSELYMVRDKVWKDAGMEGYGGCLCI